MQAYQLQFFVPHSHLGSVKEAVFNAGAGQIGEYKHCAWQVAGTGQFIPTTAAQPAIGSCNMLEEVQEYLVVVFCSHSIVDTVIQALVRAHPYEEPVYCTQIVTMGATRLCDGK